MGKQKGHYYHFQSDDDFQFLPSAAFFAVFQSSQRGDRLQVTRGLSLFTLHSSGGHLILSACLSSGICRRCPVKLHRLSATMSIILARRRTSLFFTTSVFIFKIRLRHFCWNTLSLSDRAPGGFRISLAYFSDRSFLD